MSWLITLVAVAVIGGLGYYHYTQTNSYKQEHCISGAIALNSKPATPQWIATHPNELQANIDNCKSYYPTN